MANPPTLFLSGSSGLVGSALRRRLLGTAEFRVIPLLRGEGALPGKRSDRDLVVHAAWPASDASSWAPFRDWSLRLRRSAADRGALFVALGSGIEAHAAHPGLKDPYKSYALRKLELRDELAEVDRDRFVWIRLHFLFGSGERPSRLVPSAIRACLSEQTFVCGSLDRRRRWLQVDDQAKYLADFLKAPQPGEWDIAGRRDVSFRDLLRLIERATGRKLQLRESDEPTPDSAIPIVAPERMAPVVPAAAGDLGSLLGRLREYAAQIAGESTKC